MIRTSPDFDRRAPHYEQHAPVQREAAAWLAEWLPERIDGPALELGAGTGLFTRHLAPVASRLVATDIAPRMVSAGVNALPGTTWSVADAAAPPRGDAYHWVFSCSLVQWLPDPGHAFRQWHGVSAPDARLLSGWFVRGTLAEFFAACPDASPFVWRDENEWRSLLRQAGWNPMRSEARVFTRHHADSGAMLREIHNAGAVIPRRLGIGRLRQALRDYDQMHLAEDGVTTTFAFLRVEAEKI
ncbi:MAG: methyltransferase domain-containing protein [Chthoniobacterales bacterium]|nr:methyltransferase domain-containing protein [Chthoniobacterales bacterium]